MNTKKFVHAIFLIIFSAWSLTLYSESSIQVLHKKFDESSGLAHRAVRAIYQDSNGQIWASSKFGINRLEGNRFVEIIPERQDLKIENVSKIGEDDAGFLWLWNDHTIYFYNQRNGKFLLLHERFPQGLPFDPVLKKQGSWKIRNQTRIIRSKTGILFFEDPNKEKVYFFNSKEGFNSFEIKNQEVRNVLCVTNDNLVYLATSNSIIKTDIQGNILDQVFVKDDLNIGRFYYQDLCLIFEAGLQTYELNRYGQLTLKEFLGGSKMYFDLYSKSYLTLNENELKVYNTQGVLKHKINNNSKLKYLFEYINDFVNDKDGSIWIATDEGVTKIKIIPKLFNTLLSFAQDKPFNNSVRNIILKNNSLYANLEMGGLVKVDLKNPKSNFEIIYDTIDKKFTSNPNKLKKDYWGRALASNSENELWIGMRHKLIKIDTLGNQLKSYPLFEITQQQDIWSLEFLNEKLWIGTGNGIAILYPSGKIEKLDLGEKHLINEAVVLDFVPSEEGMWICSENGLYLIDPFNNNLKESHFTSESKNMMKVQHLYHDKFEKNIYWLATSLGLVKWNKKENSIQNFDESNGFVNSNIYAVVEDSEKHLWLSSDKGIVRFNKGNESSRIFKKINGLSDNEFNRTSHLISKSNEIFFGGMNGITNFHPSDFVTIEETKSSFTFEVKNCIVENSTEKYSINLESIDVLKDGIFLKGKNLKIALNLIPSSNHFSDNIQYAYKILEESNTWKYSLLNKIEFEIEEKGDFTLAIKGRLIDQDWGDENLLIPIYFNSEKEYSESSNKTFLWIIPGILLGLIFYLYRLPAKSKNDTIKEEKVEDVINKNTENQESKVFEPTVLDRQKTEQSSKNSVWLEELDTLIIKNLEDYRFNVEFLASELNISRRSLQRKIKESSGMSPSEYINDVRLNVAKEYLSSGKFKTLKETSTSIGIRNQGYFAEIFKAKFGISPIDILKNKS